MGALALPLALALQLALVLAAGDDLSALVQGVVRAHRHGQVQAQAVEEEAEAFGDLAQPNVGQKVRMMSMPEEVAPLVVSEGRSLVHTDVGPVAFTKNGPIQGVCMEGYNVFQGIPYKEKTERWQVGERKRPWAPQMLSATQFQPSCIGAHTGVVEAEDCLYLNVWTPTGNFTNVPVIVYFHGGMNQHGSGHEEDRQGDGIVRSAEHPVIFINFDFRLGIFGWISLPGSGIPENIGFQDQQEVLRWTRDHIAAFGGDPSRITVMGQSEGCSSILAHLVAPGSTGLFQSVAMVSPVADVWTRGINELRTRDMIERAQCERPTVEEAVRCLRAQNAGHLWTLDWAGEELTSNAVWMPRFGSNMFGMLRNLMQHGTQNVAGRLGWHIVPDNATMPAEPRELIRQGRWHKVPVLMTIAKNESHGVLPVSNLLPVLGDMGMQQLVKSGDYERIKQLYMTSLTATGVHADRAQLLHQMLTDKLWTCDVRKLAASIEEAGGQAYLGIYWHSNKYDPASRGFNPVCEHGAACHAGDMFYILPQGHGVGVDAKSTSEEAAFQQRYTESFLSFAYGERHPWARYDSTKPFTLYDENGPRVVPGYRREQCEVLDSSMGEFLPRVMREGL